MGLIHKEVQETRKVYVGFTCNKCKKTYDKKEDWIDIQEVFHHSACGGFGSVIGDMAEWEVTLCQECMNEILGPYIEVVTDWEEELDN